MIYPTILFDADDVLLDLVPYWLQHLSMIYGTEVAPEDVTEWDMTKFFPKLTEEQVYSPLHFMGFWDRIPAVPEAQKYMERLHSEGYEMYVVTATNPYTAGEKVQRLLYLYPFLDEAHVIIAQNKQMIRGNILVDDCVHNLEGGDYIKVLFTRPHNRSYSPKPGPDMIIRADTWEDIYKTITKIYPKGVNFQ